MSNKEPKVSFYYNVPESCGAPILCPIQGANLPSTSKVAVVMWQSDYDAMRKEMEELRAWKEEMCT
jgi:hypothetical protein